MCHSTVDACRVSRVTGTARCQSQVSGVSSSTVTDKPQTPIPEPARPEFHQLLDQLARQDFADAHSDGAPGYDFDEDDIPEDVEGPAWKSLIPDEEVRAHWLHAEIDKLLSFQDKNFQKRDALLLAFTRVSIRVHAQLKSERERMEAEARKHKLNREERRKLSNSVPTLKQFISVLTDYPDIWRTHFGDDGFAKVPELPLRWDPTYNDGKGPLKGIKRSRRLSPDQMAWLEKHLDLLSSSNIIEKIQPDDEHVRQHGIPKACGIFIVPKKEAGEWRMIEDFRNVNLAIDKFCYNMLEVKDSLHHLEGATNFATLDALKGYNQFPVSRDLSYSLVIATSTGELYRFKALPMGFINSAQWYAFVMNDYVLKDLVRHICLAYIDDILVYAKSGQDLLRRLRFILDACRAHNVQLNILKSVLYSDYAIWCGRKVVRGGKLKLPDNVVDSITSIGRPTNARMLQQFLCSMNWYSSWIPGYAEKARPLHELMEVCYSKAGSRRKRAVQKVRVVLTTDPALNGLELLQGVLWKPEHQRAFEGLKDELQNHVELAAPKSDQDRNVLVDASDYAWSLILTQTPPEQGDQPIEERDHEVLHILSGKFSGNSINWHISEKEAYGIFKAARDCEWLLHDAKPVHIYTDHRNLLRLFSPQTAETDVKRPAASRLLRWSLMIMGCNYRIHSIDGNRNVFADYISRVRQHPQKPVPIRGIRAESVRVGSTRASKRRRFSQPVPKSLSKTDPAAFQFRLSRVRPLLHKTAYISEFEIANAQANALQQDKSIQLPEGSASVVLPTGTRLIKVGKKIFLPKHGTRRILAKMIVIAHTMCGHRGVQAVKQNLQDRYVFEGNLDDVAVAQFARECLHCRPDVSYFPRPYGQLPRAAHKNQILHMDYFYVCDGILFKYVLVLMDNATQFLHLTNSASPDAETAALALMRWEALHGLRPDSILVSDQGSHFTAELVQIWCKLSGVRQDFTVANTPWTNSRIERVNRVIKAAYQSLLSQTRLDVAQFHLLTPAVNNVLNSLKRRNLAIDGRWRSPKSLMNAIPEDEIRRNECVITSDGHPTALDTSVYFRDENSRAAKREFVQLAAEFRDYHSTLTKAQAARDVRRAAEHREFFDACLNFSPGDYVLVAAHTRYNLKDQKVKFRWSGPARVVAMHGNSLATVEHVLGAEDVNDKLRREKVHTTRLAFYSHELEDVDVETRIQVLHDNNQFVVKEFIQLADNPHGPGYAVQCSWEGFSPEFTSYEPVDSLYADLGARFVRWLQKHARTTSSQSAIAEFKRIHKKYVAAGHQPLAGVA